MLARDVAREVGREHEAGRATRHGAVERVLRLVKVAKVVTQAALGGEAESADVALERLLAVMHMRNMGL